MADRDNKLTVRISVAIAVNLRRLSGKNVYTKTLPFSRIVPSDLPRAPDSIDLHFRTPVLNTNFMLSEESSGNTFGQLPIGEKTSKQRNKQKHEMISAHKVFVVMVVYISHSRDDIEEPYGILQTYFMLK